MSGSFYVETLGCPKNQVDSDKLVGVLEADGYAAADDPTDADLLVINTCAFVEEARQESIDTILAFSDRRAPGAKLVVTGCLAERYRDELAQALPEVDLVAPFGVPVTIGRKGERAVPSLDLLELPRPPATAPWAYVKVAEGCDRACGFCAIPSFRGPQLGRGGYFHSDKMRVVEKFTRTGNQMLYEVTVEDPEVLVEPWVMPSRMLRLSPNNTIIAERGSCTESELKEVSSQYRH